MTYTQILAMLAALTLLVSVPSLARAAAQKPEASQTALPVEAFCDLFYKQKKVRQAFETYVVEDYIQHSPGIGQGREAAIGYVEPLFAREGFKVEALRTLVDGDMVTVILKARMPSGQEVLVIDLFRTQNGLIVEHWDVKYPVPAEAAPSFFAGFIKTASPIHKLK